MKSQDRQLTLCDSEYDSYHGSSCSTSIMYDGHGIMTSWYIFPNFDGYHGYFTSNMYDGHGFLTS